jgi:hypothetical protein
MYVQIKNNSVSAENPIAAEAVSGYYTDTGNNIRAMRNSNGGNMGQAANVNRQYKSSVFSSYFSDGGKLAEAYGAINGRIYSADAEVQINTLEDALFMGRINDVSFLLDSKLIVLMEHQSYPNRNLPIRMLLYIGRIYEKLLENENIYRSKLIRIPKPDFIVLYNGDEECPDRKEMKLSEAFEDAGIPNLLDLTVRVYNINKGHNRKIFERSKALSDYAIFIGRVKENRAKGLPPEEAVEEAVRYCIDRDIMREYLETHSSEVRNMLFTEFNMDDAKEIWREEGFEDGMEKGIEKGVEKAARAALAKGISVSDVADITGLDEETVKNLRAGVVM